MSRLLRDLSILGAPVRPPELDEPCLLPGGRKTEMLWSSPSCSSMDLPSLLSARSTPELDHLVAQAVERMACDCTLQEQS